MLSSLPTQKPILGIGGIVGISVASVVIVAVVIVVLVLIYGASTKTFPRSLSPSASPVNCEWIWSLWSPCSPSCGPGTQTQNIIIQQYPAYGGSACPVVVTQTQSCFTTCDNSLFISTGPLNLTDNWLSYINSQSPFTIGFWTILTSASYISQLVGSSNQWSTNNSSYTSISAFGGQWNYNSYSADTSFQYIPVCIMVRYNGFDANTDFIVNGVSTGAIPATAYPTGSGPIMFFDDGANGRVREFRMWNISLSDSQVADFYNNGTVTESAIAESNTLLTFHLNDGYGTQILESISGTYYTIDAPGYKWDDGDFFATN